MIYSLRMKKNILLVLLSASLLAGCNVDLGFIKVGDNSSNQTENQQNNENSQEKPQENGNNNNNSNENNNNQQSPELIGESGYTATLLTSGSSFATKFPGGSHIDNETKKQQLTDYLSSQLEYSGLIESLTCTLLNTQTYDNETYMQFGSQNGVGGLGFTSGLKIYKVEVKVLCFAKHNSYQNILNVDNSAHFLINDQDNDMSYDGEKPPSVMSFEKSFENGVNTVTLGSKSGRVFLKEMTITWKK